MSAAGMHNTEGINVDLYIPRKWCVPTAPAAVPRKPKTAAQGCRQI